MTVCAMEGTLCIDGNAAESIVVREGSGALTLRCSMVGGGIAISKPHQSADVSETSATVDRKVERRRTGEDGHSVRRGVDTSVIRHD